MDALSETLRAVRLEGTVLVDARLGAPWCYEIADVEAIAPFVAHAPERGVVFHLITAGECFLEMDGRVPNRLTAGHAAIVPHGGTHCVASAAGLVPAAAGWPPSGPATAPATRHARPTLACPADFRDVAPGAVTHLVSGYVTCDARFARMLLAGLPPSICVDVRDMGVWLDAALRHALAQAALASPGAAALLATLAEVLVIEILRHHSNAHANEVTNGRVQLPAGGRTGWLAGLNDRVVGSALNALHKQPAHGWTLDELARSASTSRSVLAERFQQLVGSSPMQYLTQWRMMLAADLLARSNAPLARIAEDVGYHTDTAFSRAFRREYGAPPAAWRRRHAARSAVRQEL